MDMEYIVTNGKQSWRYNENYLRQKNKDNLQVEIGGKKVENCCEY